MSNIITTTGRSIGTVTAEIVAISNQAAQMAYMSMIEIGKRLVEAKDLVEHGEWGDWLKNEVKFSQRTANNFMNIYRRSIDGNSQAFANLGYSQIVELLALPAGDAEAFVEKHDVQDMSVRELKAAIAEEKQQRIKAQEQLAEMSGENKRLEATVSTLRNDTKLMENSEERARKSEANALNLVEKYKKELQAAQEKERQLRMELEEARENPEIPEAMLEQIREKAEADAKSLAARELEEKLAQAQSAAREAEAKLESAQKAAKMADPDVAQFNLLGKQILENFNRLEGYRMKVAAKNPEMDPKMRGFMKKLAEVIQGKAAQL